MSALSKRRHVAAFQDMPCEPNAPNFRQVLERDALRLSFHAKSSNTTVTMAVMPTQAGARCLSNGSEPRNGNRRVAERISTLPGNGAADTT